MRIQYLADIHREFMNNKAGLLPTAHRRLLDSIRDCDADVLVLAGDLWKKRRSVELAAELANGRPCVLVAGNHDYYGDSLAACIHALRKRAQAHPNVHFLEREAVEIDGVVFLGCSLWTNMRLFASGPYAGLYDYEETLNDCQTGMNDYLYIRASGSPAPLKPVDTVKIWQKSLRWLHEELHRHAGKPTVVVTHHAPSWRSLQESYHQDILSAAYASHLDRFIELHQPDLWIHGHVHDCLSYTIGRTLVLCNCRGYDTTIAQATGFHPKRLAIVNNRRTR